MFVLYLNHMRDRAEVMQMVAKASTAEALEAFLARESVPPYTDHATPRGWRKVYRKGGPLEWYNPPGSGVFGVFGIRKMMTAKEVAQREVQHYLEFLAGLPEV